MQCIDQDSPDQAIFPLEVSLMGLEIEAPVEWGWKCLGFIVFECSGMA